MKLAGFLALVLAVVLCSWAITDYYHNEHDRQYNLELMQGEISRELSGGRTSGTAMERDKEIEPQNATTPSSESSVSVL